MYLDDLKKCLDELDMTKLEEAKKLLKTSHRVFVIGNGGSFATASHIGCDFSKKANLDVFTFDNTSTLTAWSNDNSYEDCFAIPLAKIMKIGDIVFCISSSGNSSNVVRAATVAKGFGVKVISLTGFDGGKLKELSDVNIHVNINAYDISEDVHLTIGHMLTRMLGEK